MNDNLPTGVNEGHINKGERSAYVERFMEDVDKDPIAYMNDRDIVSLVEYIYASPKGKKYLTEMASNWAVTKDGLAFLAAQEKFAMEYEREGVNG